jgi:hypothetical protein
MAQSNIIEHSFSFYGNPESPSDFPNGISPCVCRGMCKESCKRESQHIKCMLFHMHTAITELGYWNDFIKNPPSTKTGFMFADAKWIYDISAHPLVYEDSHSGGSFANCMRFMEFIALNGWNEFIKGWTISKLCDFNYTELSVVIVA